MHHLLNRRAGLGALVTGALLATLALAPAAPAATIKACQKKKGGALRIITGKAKCKSKTEKTLSWSTTGPAGKNGANGANGTNGANGKDGAAGLVGPAGPGAVRFNGAGNPPFLGNVTIASFSAGGVDFRVICGNAFLFDAVKLQAKSATAATVLQSGVIAKNPTDPGTVFTKTALTAGDDFADIDQAVANASGPAENQAVYTYVVDTGSKTVVVQAGLTVLSGCTASGWAVPTA